MSCESIVLDKGKIKRKVVFLDFLVQKELVFDLVSRGYDLTHEENGFVRLEKTIFFDN